MSREHQIIQLGDKVRPIVRGDGTMPDLLYDLLTTPTRHGTESRLHKFLPFMQENWAGPKPTIDTKGNIILDIGEPKKDFRTVFSCHLDTVHNANTDKMGLVYTLQDGTPDTEGMVYATTTYKSVKEGAPEVLAPCILGADDKLGIYIMLKFIENNIPGRYIFHVGEECGGVGSGYISRTTPEVLKHMRRAIAFDRANYTDCISFQRGRCCSTEFSTAMANAINEHLATREMMFKPDVVGVWTDTANYVDLVSECTNISVGYFNQHTSNEHFDLIWYLHILVPALLKVDWESLPTVRDKTKKETAYGYGEYGSFTPANNSQFDPVKFAEITPDTPLYKIPEWSPLQGIPVDLKPGALGRLCEGFVNKNQYKTRELALILGGLLRAADDTEQANRDMRRHIIKTGDAVFKDTSIKMNAMRRLVNVFHECKAAKSLKFDTGRAVGVKPEDAIARIHETVNDFGLLDDQIKNNFLKCQDYQKEINMLMETMAMTLYPVVVTSASFKACYKNLVRTIKTYSKEDGFELLFKDKADA